MTDYERELTELWISAKDRAEHHEMCVRVAEEHNNPNWAAYHRTAAAKKREDMARYLSKLPARDEQKEAA